MSHMMTRIRSGVKEKDSAWNGLPLSGTGPAHHDEISRVRGKTGRYEVRTVSSQVIRGYADHAG